MYVKYRFIWGTRNLRYGRAKRIHPRSVRGKFPKKDSHLSEHFANISVVIDSNHVLRQIWTSYRFGVSFLKIKRLPYLESCLQSNWLPRFPRPATQSLNTCLHSLTRNLHSNRSIGIRYTDHRDLFVCRTCNPASVFPFQFVPRFVPLFFRSSEHWNSFVQRLRLPFLFIRIFVHKAIC